MRLFTNIFLILSLVACTQVSKKKEVIKAKPPQGAILIDEGQAIEEPKTTIVEKEPPKLGIILGPGSVKAFAHTGVLKELEKAKIPISYIIGIEWGALVGGLYATSAKINDTEWKLYKLQAKKLNNESWFSLDKKEHTIRSYHDFFEQNIGEQSFNDLKIPFVCPSISIWSGATIWQEAGSLKKAIERCMPSPPLFHPKGPWMAALFSSEEAIEFLRQKGMDVILYVDVLGESQPLSTKELMNNYTSALLWQELKNDISRVAASEGLLKVQPNTFNFKIYDFNSRSSLANSGLKSGLEAADILVERYNF
ncbi:MAG: hypothetical protein KDD58_10055 [Bdellovibrionales bacterium]|nr:hypothetical protein [Bdellovibrionales bacterium]